jgi:hypothetical protein
MGATFFLAGSLCPRAKGAFCPGAVLKVEQQCQFNRF